MSAHELHPGKMPPGGCISLIGMAGVGKSTVGAHLARELDWAHLDTDRLLEAFYGLPLQQIFDELGRESFLAAEELVVANMGAKRCVISTGGSVVYGPRAVARLRELGPVVHLQAELEVVRSRIDNIDQRGLAMAPGQTLDSLYEERRPLYAAAATLVVATDKLTPLQCAEAILHWLKEPE